MAMYIEHLAAQPSLFYRVIDRVVTLRAALSHRLAQQAEANRVFAELSTLSDADLNDIGISRHAIRDIAREAGCMI